jgi:phosphatidylglycerol:prolipoprotein diacylglycerol transferase
MFPVFLKLNVLGHEIPFHSYGFFLGLAFFLGAQLCLFLAAKDGLPRASVVRLACGVIAAGYVGGHVYTVATDPEGRLWSGAGFTFYVSALSGAAAAYPLCRWLSLPFAKMTDAGAPALALAHGTGRIGCFLAGCCFGVPSEHGVCFPRESPAFMEQARLGLVNGAVAAHSLPVVPVQLIEAGYDLVLSLALATYLVRARPRAGTAFLLYLVAYGTARAVLERFRADPNRGLVLGVSLSTFLGIATALAALVLLAPPLARRRASREGTAGAPGRNHLDSPTEGTS